MLEDNGKKKLGLAKMFMQSAKQPIVSGPPASSHSELFDLKNFRKGLRTNLTGKRDDGPGGGFMSGMELSPKHSNMPKYESTSPGGATNLFIEKNLTFSGAGSKPMAGGVFQGKSAKAEGGIAELLRRESTSSKQKDMADSLRNQSTRGALSFGANHLLDSKGSRAYDKPEKKIEEPLGFHFRQSASGMGNKAGLSVEKAKHSGSNHDYDSSTPKPNSQFLSNLNRLKDINSRGLSAGRDPLKSENKALSAFGGDEGSSNFFVKKQTVLSGFDVRASPLITDKSANIQFNSKNLEGKRTELKGRLNDLLDKLTVSGSVRGETRSVAPILNRGDAGDDNLSLNSFHSTTNQKLLQPSAGFTSLYQ